MASPRTIIIDPMNVTADQEIYLRELFKVYDRIPKFEAAEKYSLTLEGRPVLVQLTNSILHEVRMGVDQVLRSHYRILPGENVGILGNGTFGQVCKVFGTLFHKPGSGLSLKIGKPKVIKISNLIQDNRFSSLLFDVASWEAGISRSLPHLHIKPPVITDDTFYVAMREFAGMDLFDLISKLIQDPTFISADQCLRISINMMKALKKIHQLGVMHNDIKPENIIVDHLSGDVNIIDFGCADYAGDQPINAYQGTKRYAAPEMDDGKAMVTKAADVYSLGLSLRLLWGGLFDELNIDTIKARRIKGDESCVLDLNLLSVWGLEDRHASLIFSTLNSLINLNPTERFLEHSIEVFERIRIERKCLGDEDKQDVLLTANRLANQVVDTLPVVVGPDGLTFLQNLENSLLDGIQALSSDPLALAEFKEALNIALFKDVENKAGLDNLVRSTICNFVYTYRDIQGALERSDLNNHQKESLQLVLNKYSRPYLTLDNMASIAQKAQNLLNELEPAPGLVLN